MSGKRIEANRKINKKLAKKSSLSKKAVIKLKFIQLFLGSRIKRNEKHGAYIHNISKLSACREYFYRFFHHANLSSLYLQTKNKEQKKRKNLKIGVSFILLGLLIISSPVLYKKVNILNKNYTPTPSPEVILEIKKPTISDSEPIKVSKELTKNIDTIGEEIPVRLIIPRLNIDIPVLPSKVIDGNWELSDNSASFGLGSAFPGDRGNTVIFGHARENILGPLKRIAIKDRVHVLTQKHYFSYEVNEIKSVYPSQVEVVAPQSDDRLTLFTCSGFLDKQRLVVIAKRI